MTEAERVLLDELSKHQTEIIESECFLKDNILDAMREYAKIVAEQTLKDAAERLSSDKITAKKIILSTPIKLP